MPKAHRPSCLRMSFKKRTDKNFQMDQKTPRRIFSFVETSRRSQIPADQDSFTKKSPGARLVSPAQRIRRPSMQDLFELNNESGFDQRKTSTPNLTKSLSSPLKRRWSSWDLSSLEVSSDFSSRSNFVDGGEEATEALTFVHDDASLRERIVDFLHISGLDRVLLIFCKQFSL